VQVFPDQVLASKYRDSTESSFLLNAIKSLLPAWCFHPEQIWAGEGSQECGPFAIRYPVARSNVSKFGNNINWGRLTMRPSTRSALRLSTDIVCVAGHVRKVPIGDIRSLIRRARRQLLEL
jgi:hypothetical protein